MREEKRVKPGQTAALALHVQVMGQIATAVHQSSLQIITHLSLTASMAQALSVTKEHCENVSEQIMLLAECKLMRTYARKWCGGGSVGCGGCCGWGFGCCGGGCGGGVLVVVKAFEKVVVVIFVVAL